VRVSRGTPGWEKRKIKAEEYLQRAKGNKQKEKKQKVRKKEKLTRTLGS